jgi:hypothetical protein
MMDNEEKILELRKGNAVLGTLTITEQDMFWFTCDFVPTPAFEEYRQIFAEEFRLLNDGAGADKLWEEIYEKITELKLSLLIGNKFDNENHFLLHILDTEASFRPLKPWVGGWVGG